MSTQTQIVPVKGMDCASCASTISKVLSKVEGVSACSVNYATEKANLSFDPQVVSLKTLSDKITPFGYSLGENAPMGMPGHDHRQMEGKNKEEKLLNLQKQKRTVTWLMPLALVIFGLMIWDNLTMLFGLMPLPVSPQIMGLVNLVLATIVIFGPGMVFLRAVVASARLRVANMDTLIGLGTGVAYFYSLFVTLLPELVDSFGLSTSSYFDVVIVVTAFILFGKYLEANSKLKTGEAIEKLFKLQAKTALVERKGKEMEIAIDQVVVGDIIIIKPGAKIPVDGVVVEGSSSIDESMVTGEPMPEGKKKGDGVIGGTINKQGFFKFRAQKVGQQTMLAQIIKLVGEAQNSKASIERLADRISAVFVPLVLAIAVLTLIVWLLVGSQFMPLTQALALGLSAFVGILVIACPCALGLATPTAMIVGVGKAAEHGILVKDAESLEKLEKVGVVIMDKTGTLTRGQPEVVEISGQNPKELLTVLASLEKNSEHPLASAVLEEALKRKLTLRPVGKFKALEGKGVAGRIGNADYLAGNVTLMKEQKIEFDLSQVQARTKEGKTPILVAKGKNYLGAVFVADALKENSVEAVAAMHKLGLKLVMLTGDDEDTAKYIADKAGIDHVVAGVLPSEKADEVRQQKNGGGLVAMIGDGINDAPALAFADVGIAMGTGTDVAIESANITLLGGDLTKAVSAMVLAKKTMRTVRQNLFWAFIYNVIGIPLAAGLLYPFFGIMLNPIFAGMAMALSSVSVVTNSLRLKGAKI